MAGKLTTPIRRLRKLKPGQFMYSKKKNINYYIHQIYPKQFIIRKTELGWKIERKTESTQLDPLS